MLQINRLSVADLVFEKHVFRTPAGEKNGGKLDVVIPGALEV
jgi:hypothetical protein